MPLSTAEGMAEGQVRQEGFDAVVRGEGPDPGGDPFVHWVIHTWGEPERISEVALKRRFGQLNTCTDDVIVGWWAQARVVLVEFCTAGMLTLIHLFVSRPRFELSQHGPQWAP